MFLAPVYCSSDPPPASGPVRSKMTPILIFLSWASAEAAIPSAAPATISPPSRRAALRTSIKTSLENCGLCLLVFIDAHHMGSAGGCQAARPRHSGAPRHCIFKYSKPIPGKPASCEPTETGFAGAGHVASGRELRGREKSPAGFPARASPSRSIRCLVRRVNQEIPYTAHEDHGRDAPQRQYRLVLSSYCPR